MTSQNLKFWRRFEVIRTKTTDFRWDPKPEVDSGSGTLSEENHYLDKFAGLYLPKQECPRAKAVILYIKGLGFKLIFLLSGWLAPTW